VEGGAGRGGGGPCNGDVGGGMWVHGV